MTSEKNAALKRALENQIRRLNKKTDELEQWSNRVSLFRLLDVLLGLVLIYFAARSESTVFFAAALFVVIGGFVVLVNWHRKIDRAINAFSGLAKIRSAHLARMQLDWKSLPNHHDQQSYNSHPFARDFDIIGEHSLLQLVDTTSYPGGRNCLKEWFINTSPNPSEIEHRQALVKELKPMAYFRDKLGLYANLAKKAKKDYDWTMDDLTTWLRSSQKTGFTTPLVILGTMAAVNISLLVLYLIGLIDPYVIFTLVLYLLTYNFYRGKIAGISDEAYQIETLLTEFRKVLQHLESFPYKEHSLLNTFCKPFHQSEQRPSRYLKKIIRIASGAALQNSDLVQLLINMIVPWDLYFSKKLNEYKAELAPRLEEWLERFYELEALSAMANFGWLNAGYTFSVPQKDSNLTPVLEAKNLGHPLIHTDKKVTNDVRIEHTGNIMLITGSNMAGKSTFLRTIGINLALCFAGAPVNATSFDTVLFRLFSSINVTDSLDEGLSHFYAEVKRLRALLDQLNQPNDVPLFFMVDEIYRGTNNRERLAGSTAFLKQVANKNGAGLVSTHDLELAQLEEQIPSLSNWHFAETIDDGKMHFEYKLKPGPCPSTNALKIMEMEGLPV